MTYESCSLDISRQTLYVDMLIQSFRCRDTERLFNQEFVKRFSSIKEAALRKLMVLNAATEPADLYMIPGNRYEALKGGREGKSSIRINDQWRLCFVWREGHAWEVEIVDYH